MPERTEAAKKLQARLDGWQNLKTGLGVQGKDRRLGTHFRSGNRLEYQECAELYRFNDMAARAVDSMPNDCARKGFAVSIEGDSEGSEATAKALRDLQAFKHVKQAHKWQRAYGGAALYVGANDGQTADFPLDLKRVRSVDFLLPLDTMELIPDGYYTNPFEVKYGMPATYRLNRFGALNPPMGVGTKTGALQMLQAAATLSGGKPGSPFGGSNWNMVPIVHETRIIRFDGILINRIQLREQRGWLDPIFNRAEPVLKDFGVTWESAALLLSGFTQDILRMKGLGELYSADGPKTLQAMADFINGSRSLLNMLLLDSEDEFETRQTPVTGLADLLDRFCNRLAAAFNMPVTRLMGQSPAGLNATGQQDASWWDNEVQVEQEEVWVPALTRLCEILFAAEKGPTKGATPDNWTVTPNPLKQLGPLEEAQRRLAIAQTDAIYMTGQAVTPEEVAVTRFGGDEYEGGKIQLVETNPAKRAAMAAEAAPDGSGDGSDDGTGDGGGSGDGTGG